MFGHSLTNRHVDLKLQLRLFEAVVLPSALYGLSTAPLTAAHLEKLDATQRKMMRRMLGFVKERDDTWEDAQRRMTRKPTTAIRMFKVRIFSEELARRRQALFTRVAYTSTNPLVTQVFSWDPKDIADPKLEVTPFKSRGRPRTTWCQYVNKDV